MSVLQNLREQFKSPTTSQMATSSSAASIYSTTSGVGANKSLEPPAPSTSRRGSLNRSNSNGNVRRAKSTPKKTIIAKVFSDDTDQEDYVPDLSMETTLLIVKRCIKEIRERGLTTKDILHHIGMPPDQKFTMNLINMILDDDASTELSQLHDVDIHLVAHAMKWAIRYSEKTLVTYEDYQTLYVEQDRNFAKFIQDLPPIHRAILLELFSLCADVRLLAHLNNMTLVTVAKAISLCIMAGPVQKFTTFDSSFQHRNLCGAACEELLRAFLRIKTSYDLAKINQEDEIDENRYVDNITRMVKSARQRSNENGNIPRHIALPSRLDISLPSSAGSSMQDPSGWPQSAPTAPAYTGGFTPRGSNGGPGGYFDHVPQSASPFSHSNGTFGASLSRSHSLAKSSGSGSRPLSPATHVRQEDEITEYEAIMQNQNTINRLRQEAQTLRPAVEIRRRSSITEMEHRYHVPTETVAPNDGYESEPEAHHSDLISDISDGLGWNLRKELDFESHDGPSLDEVASKHDQGIAKYGVNRSNSASSNGSGLGPSGPMYTGSPKTVRDQTRQQVSTTRLRQLQEQHQTDHSDDPRDIPGSPSQITIQRPGQAAKVRGQSLKGNTLSPVFRRASSFDPSSIHGRGHTMSEESRSEFDEDLRRQFLQVRDTEYQDLMRGQSEFPLQCSPNDLDIGHVGPRPGMRDRAPSIVELDIGEGISLMPEFMNNGEVSTPTQGSSSLSPFHVHPFDVMPPSAQSSAASPAMSIENGGRRFEVVSRSRDNDVSYSPITPVSPRPGRAISPSVNSKAMKRNPLSISTKVGQMGSIKTGSPSSSTLSSPQQNRQMPDQVSSAKVVVRPPPLKQGITFSSTSAVSTTTEGGKSKTPGFIRALAKLRSKQNDDTPRSAKVGFDPFESSPVISAVPPSVSIEPPRLELNFLEDLGRIGKARSGDSDDDDDTPPTSAPALMLHQTTGKSLTLENWRRQAQELLPIPPSSLSLSDGENTDDDDDDDDDNEIMPTAAMLAHDYRPRGFTGARRASAVVYGSNGVVAVKDQRQMLKKMVSSPSLSPLSAAIAITAPPPVLENVENEESKTPVRKTFQPTKQKTLPTSQSLPLLPSAQERTDSPKQVLAPPAPVTVPEIKKVVAPVQEAASKPLPPAAPILTPVVPVLAPVAPVLAPVAPVLAPAAPVLAPAAPILAVNTAIVAVQEPATLPKSSVADAIKVIEARRLSSATSPQKDGKFIETGSGGKGTVEEASTMRMGMINSTVTNSDPLSLGLPGQVGQGQANKIETTETQTKTVIRSRATTCESTVQAAEEMDSKSHPQPEQAEVDPMPVPKRRSAVANPSPQEAQSRIANLSTRRRSSLAREPASAQHLHHQQRLKAQQRMSYHPQSTSNLLQHQYLQLMKQTQLPLPSRHSLTQAQSKARLANRQSYHPGQSTNVTMQRRRLSNTPNAPMQGRRQSNTPHPPSYMRRPSTTCHAHPSRRPSITPQTNARRPSITPQTSTRRPSTTPQIYARRTSITPQIHSVRRPSTPSHPYPRRPSTPQHGPTTGRRSSVTTTAHHRSPNTRRASPPIKPLRQSLDRWSMNSSSSSSPTKAAGTVDFFSDSRMSMERSGQGPSRTRSHGAVVSGGGGLGSFSSCSSGVHPLDMPDNLSEIEEQSVLSFSSASSSIHQAESIWGPRSAPLTRAGTATTTAASSSVTEETEETKSISSGMGGLFGKKLKSSTKHINKGVGRLTRSIVSQASSVSSSSTSSKISTCTNKTSNNGGKESKGGRKKRLLPIGVQRRDVMTKTEESLDEVFPWMCIEHMAGQESGWVMLEPVQDGAVGWIVVDRLEEDEFARCAGPRRPSSYGLDEDASAL